MSEKTKNPKEKKVKKVKKLKKIKLKIKTPVDDKTKEISDGILDEAPLEEKVEENVDDSDDETSWISPEGVLKNPNDFAEFSDDISEDNISEDEDLDSQDKWQEELKDLQDKTKANLEKINATNELPENLTEYVTDATSESYSDESDSDSDDELRKIDNELYNNILLEYHPELQENNYKEIISYSNVSRNKLGQIIDPLHTTIPFLTKFEKAKILGLRSKQINKGSQPFIEVSKDIIDSYVIAEMELKQKAIPFIIKRPIPNGGCEYWKIQDLELLD